MSRIARPTVTPRPAAAHRPTPGPGPLVLDGSRRGRTPGGRRPRAGVRLAGLLVTALVLAGCADGSPDPVDAADDGATEAVQPYASALDVDTGTAVVAGESVEAAPVPGDHHVGEVTDELWIGVAVDGDDVVVYLCDDDLGVWLRGDLVDGRAQLTDADAGASVDLELTDAGVVGTATLDGVASDEAFEAPPATGDDGLYRAEVTVEEVHYVGGWIVLLASQVGAITL